MTPKCIWPHKKKYKSRPKAARNARIQNTHTPTGEKIAPYRCGDHWHLGKLSTPKPPAAKRDIQRHFETRRDNGKT